MTTEDEKLAAVTLYFREEYERYGVLDTRYAFHLAEVLVATRRELAETRRLVDALMGPVVVHGPLEFKSRSATVEPSGRTTVSLGDLEPPQDNPSMVTPDRDPCPLAGQHECRWQLGVRGCVGDAAPTQREFDPVPGCCGNVGCPGCVWEEGELTAAPDAWDNACHKCGQVRCGCTP